MGLILDWWNACLSLNLLSFIVQFIKETWSLILMRFKRILISDEELRKIKEKVNDLTIQIRRR